MNKKPDLFYTLPPELRSMVYEHVFQCADTEPLILLGARGPPSNLLRTCGYINRECGPIYRHALSKNRRARALLLESMLSEIEDKRDADTFSDGPINPRYDALHFAITALARGAHRAWKEYRQCGHECEKFDNYYCRCLEHRACFNCGKCLAVAIYYDLHPELRIPQLIKQDGRVTGLGLAVKAYLKPHSPNIRAKFGFARYPPHDQCHRFGETWWRFECFRQCNAARSVYYRSRMRQGLPVSRNSVNGLAKWDDILAQHGFPTLGWRAVRAARGPPTPPPATSATPIPPPPTPPAQASPPCARNLLSCELM